MKALHWFAFAALTVCASMGAEGDAAASLLSVSVCTTHQVCRLFQATPISSICCLALWLAGRGFTIGGTLGALGGLVGDVGNAVGGALEQVGQDLGGALEGVISFPPLTFPPIEIIDLPAIEFPPTWFPPIELPSVTWDDVIKTLGLDIPLTIPTAVFESSTVNAIVTAVLPPGTGDVADVIAGAIKDPGAAVQIIEEAIAVGKAIHQLSEDLKDAEALAVIIPVLEKIVNSDTIDPVLASTVGGIVKQAKVVPAIATAIGTAIGGDIGRVIENAGQTADRSIQDTAAILTDVASAIVAAHEEVALAILNGRNCWMEIAAGAKAGSSAGPKGAIVGGVAGALKNVSACVDAIKYAVDAAGQILDTGDAPLDEISCQVGTAVKTPDVSAVCCYTLLGTVCLRI